MKLQDFDSFFKNLKNKNIYVGFSGGADSRLILELSSYFKNKYHYKLQAINFEHGIRGKESIEDSEFCKKTCEQLKIPISVISLNLCSYIKNIECVAREKRLDYYKKIAKEDKNHIILLGHHLDDKIENFFIRLTRGSNIAGLTSLDKYTYIDDVFIGRPLLSYSKSDIINYMKLNNIEYKTDITNFNTEYHRNYLRNNLLMNWFNKFSFAKGGVITSINNLKQDNDFIEEYSNNKFNEVYQKYLSGEAVNIKFYLNLHDAIKFRVLKKHIQLYDKNFEMKRGFFESFNKLINDYDNSNHKFLSINNQLNIVIKGYKIYIENM